MIALCSKPFPTALTQLFDAIMKPWMQLDVTAVPCIFAYAY